MNRPGRAAVRIVSVPHPAAFSKALKGDDQQQRSSYIQVFRQEGKAETLLLEDDAMRLKAMFTGSGLGSEATDEYVRLMQEPGAMTAAHVLADVMEGAKV